GTHPLIALAGLAFSLPLLTMWFIQTRRRHSSARQAPAFSDAPNRALHAAEEENRRQAEMLSSSRHDLRPPLAPIAGYVRLLRNTETPEQAPHVQAIERSVNYQLVLIDQLLECAKTELPLAIRPMQVPVNDFLDEVAGYAIALSTQQNNVFKASADS